jgi:hypothetical protein
MHRLCAVLLLFGGLHPAAAESLLAPRIKSLQIVSGVIGGEDAVGRVELTAPATSNVLITFTSKGNGIECPPANVGIKRGQSAETFVIKTTPVGSPSKAMLAAHLASAPEATAEVSVLAPDLTILDCEPKTIRPILQKGFDELLRL